MGFLLREGTDKELRSLFCHGVIVGMGDRPVRVHFLWVRSELVFQFPGTGLSCTSPKSICLIILASKSADRKSERRLTLSSAAHASAASFVRVEIQIIENRHDILSITPKVSVRALSQSLAQKLMYAMIFSKAD